MRPALLAPLIAVTLALSSASGQSSRRTLNDELKVEPRQTRLLYEAALRLEKQGKTAAAIAAYGDLLQEAPTHLNGLLHRAQLLLATGKAEEASHDLSAALLAHPEEGEAWSAYGDCLRALQRDKDAASAYAKAIERGLNTSAVNRKRGDALSASGEQAAALDSYAMAIKLRLDDPEAYLARGILLMKMKRERDAIDDFTRAIDFDPDYSYAYFRRGQAWGELGQFTDAARDLTAFLRLKPGDSQALAYRGAAFDTLGRVDEALSDYDGALKADPASARVLMARGELYSRLGRHVDALADRDRALTLEPANAYFWMARGGTQLALGNAQKAVEDRTRAVELAPSNALMWYSRAATYSALGDDGKALSDAAQALRVSPNFEAARKLIEQIEASAKAKAAAAAPAPARLQPGTPVQAPASYTAAAPKPLNLKPKALPASDRVIRLAQEPLTVLPSKPGEREIVIRPAPPTVAAPAPLVFPKAPEPVAPAPKPAAQIQPAPKPTPQVVAPAPVVSPKAPERPAPAPKPSAQQLYRDGHALLAHGEFDAATAKLAQAAALDPGNALVWNALGYGRMKQERYKEALAALDKAIELKPRYKNAYENRSAVKKLLGDGSGAARDRIKARLLDKHE
jgi:tetratricopeptide (TPR) repeat protein